MNEEEMETLLKNLEARGFADQRLKLGIEKTEQLGLPTFLIPFDRAFDGGQMFYKLQIQWNDDALGFELAAIHATLRTPVSIDRNVFQGFDTVVLDKQMDEIDWQQYWNSTIDGPALPDNFQNAIGCIDGIAQLLLSESTQAKHAGDLLMYKHWPANIYNIFSGEPDKMRRAHEHSYTFKLSSYPDISAATAYTIISEMAASFLNSDQQNSASLTLEHSNLQQIQRAIATSIVFGNPNGSLSQLTFNSPIQEILRTPYGEIMIMYAITDHVVPRLKNGDRVLNDNIPTEIYVDAGLKESQYTAFKHKTARPKHPHRKGKKL
ncbi:hypothetical protein [Pedobacter borealis]|uniref:hypothetical protein n=1 Tax=Pedobacter borealis TaxID=475254 RepID=UPI0004937905|nr:hypothetical protein [Pedobacter borealis]